jgi:hypothetical protein
LFGPAEATSCHGAGVFHGDLMGFSSDI